MQRIVILIKEGVFCKIEQRHGKSEESLKKTEDSFSYDFKSSKLIG